MKEWRQQRKNVVIVQSLWRGRKARKDYKGMREEARDLKQISYKLENKVVELTQSLGNMRRENKDLKNQVDNYEGQIKSWRNRHNVLEARTKELQAEANQAGINAARLSAVEQDFKRLQVNYDESHQNMKRLQEEEKALRQSLKETTHELETVRKRSSFMESEKSSLKQQLNELQDQLEIAKRAGPINGELTNGHGVSAPVSTGLINLVSSKRPKRRSAGAERIEMDRFSGSYNPRPVSMAPTMGAHHQKNLSGSTFSPVENIEMELEGILSDEDSLNDEVTMGLIRNLKMPSPTATPPPSDKEVLFPAYLINLVTSEMWNNGFVKESERFLANVMQSIQQEVMQHDGDEAVNPGAFW
ncbi:hypothetical protein LTS18_000128, partial [Coniosporium uncinatum]